MGKKQELKPETVKRLKDIINNGYDTKEKIVNSETYKNLFTHYMNKFEKGYADIIIDACLQDLKFNEIKILIKKDEETKMKKDKKIKSEIEHESDKIFMISGQTVIETDTPINVDIGEEENDDINGNNDESVSNKFEKELVNKLADSNFVDTIIDMVVGEITRELPMNEEQKLAATTEFKAMVDAVIATVKVDSVNTYNKNNREKVDFKDVIVETKVKENKKVETIDTKKIFDNIIDSRVKDIKPLNVDNTATHNDIKEISKCASSPNKRIEDYLDCDVSKLSLIDLNREYVKAYSKLIEDEGGIEVFMGLKKAQ